MDSKVICAIIAPPIPLRFHRGRACTLLRAAPDEPAPLRGLEQPDGSLAVVTDPAIIYPSAIYGAYLDDLVVIFEGAQNVAGFYQTEEPAFADYDEEAGVVVVFQEGRVHRILE